MATAELLILALLVNNVALVQFLGLCPLLGASRRLSSALGMTLATTLVLLLATLVTFSLERWLLLPLGLAWMRILVFILVIAALVQAADIYLSARQPLLHRSLGIYIPLITTNCALLGVILTSTFADFSLLQSLAVAAGSALGFGLVLAAFAALRERLELADVPWPFRGSAIAMLSAGLMSLGFMGFAGMGS